MLKLVDWMKKRIFWWIILGLIIWTTPFSTYASEKPTNIVVLNSYHKGLKWTDDQTEAILAGMPNSWDQQVYIEYMDWKRYPTADNLKILYENYKNKYSEQKIDLLLTTDDTALEFALKHRQELFSDAPIVFSGVLKNTADHLLRGKDKVTGVYEDLDSDGTIELALRINPEVRNIYIFHDNSESGQASGEDIKEAVERYNVKNKRKLAAYGLADLSIEEITQKVSILEKDSIVMIGSYSADKEGLVLTPEIFVNQVSTKSAVPVYSVYEFLLGSGITGGSLLSANLQGERAAELGSKILDGQELSRLPIIEDQTIVVGFDYTQLERFKISESLIPKNSVIINKPFSFIETYKSLVASASAVFLLLIGFVIVLLANIRKRKEIGASLLKQKEELTALYEELSATEEELRHQFDEIVTHQEVIKESEERHRLAMEATEDMIWEWDLVHDNRKYSEKSLKIFGYKGEEIAKYQDWIRLVHPDDLDVVEENLTALFSKKSERYHTEYRFKCKNGNYKWIRVNGKALFDSTGKPFKMVGSHRDITDLKDREKKITHLAYYDFLTGLPNRILLKELFEQETGKENPEGTFLVMLYLDVDNFKEINDSLGHSTGDQLLIIISGLLTEIAGINNTVARFGGDEFIVLLKDLKEKKEALEYAEKLIGAFDKDISLENHVCYVSVSIGVVCYPAHGESFEELFKNADTAMYKAKQLGKKKYIIFNQEMNNEVVEKAKIHNNLRRAIHNDEFILYYQPQVNLATGKIQGFEALIRWCTPDHEVISPDKFICIAEETGLIVPIGEWVLKTACTFIKKLHDLGYKDLIISVNISSVQFRQNNFLEMVQRTLAETGLAPEYLELEITETVLIDFFDSHISVILKQLIDFGVNICLDDFGRGYSSLHYIKQLPISTLKIDKTFIDDIQGEFDHRNITGAIIILAQQLGIKVVAEGVELPEQKEYLKNYHCDAIQGYIISKPIPDEEVLKLLSEAPHR